MKEVIKAVHDFMFNDPKWQFMSAGDCAEKYGKSRQYYEKLMRTGKLKYQQTKAGKITTPYWLSLRNNLRLKK